MLRKVISGGQTGADQIGLKAAKAAGLSTGGSAPKGFRTENGPKPELGTLFGMVQHWSWEYNPRTEQNVIDSDGTALFGDMSSAGSKSTIKFLKNHRKKYIENPDTIALVDFIVSNDISVLNVAGNRGSKLSKAQRSNIGRTLIAAFKYILKSNISEQDTTTLKSE